MRSLFNRLINDPATARKFFIALAGFLVVAAAQGLIADPWAAWITIIGSGATAGTVYAVPNKKENEHDRTN